MSLTIIDIGASRVLFFGHKVVQEFDIRKCPAIPSNISETINSIKTTANAISKLFECPLEMMGADEDEYGDWTWQEIANKYIRKDDPSIKLKVSCYSDDATFKGKVSESISIDSIQAIIDGANRLITVARGISKNKCDNKDFDAALLGLDEAIMSADTYHNDEVKNAALPAFKAICASQ